MDTKCNGGFVGRGPVGVNAGAWLVDFRRSLDAGEAIWLEALGRFDAEEQWAAEGQLSCVEWLTWRAGFGRATAFDKVRVARQLRCRPVLAEALASGRVSYGAIRAITRAEDTTMEVDGALVAVAEVSTVADVEAVVRAYRLYQSQEQRPAEPGVVRRGLRIRRLPEGMARLEAVLTDVEAAELEAVLRTLIDRTGGGHRAHRGDGDPTSESSREDSGGPDTAGATPSNDQTSEDSDPTATEVGAGCLSSREDCLTGAESPRSWPELHADALMDLVRSGIVAYGHGADRHLVHIVVRDGHASVLGGPPIDPAELARILCDCSHVTHTADSDGVPLSLGRRQRRWSVHQRRAVTIRDHGRCRWPGCTRTHVDIHHLHAWDAGGLTDIDNALTLCPRHHTKIHDGYFTTGAVTAELTFYQPNSRPIGTSRVPSPHVPG